MRRLPVYLVLDVSGSMHGEPIEAVRNGMQMLVSTLRTDPYALETAFLSVITFDEKARQAVPLTELMAFQPPTIEAGSTTSLGDALKVVKECIEREVKKTTAEEKGDWKPLVFLMTDGQPTDDWEKGLNEFKKVKTGMVIACAAGPQADTKVLKQITEVVVSLDTADSSTIGAFFKWVSASISTSSKKVDLTKAESSEISELPPPPPPPPRGGTNPPEEEGRGAGEGFRSICCSTRPAPCGASRSRPSTRASGSWSAPCARTPTPWRRCTSASSRSTRTPRWWCRSRPWTSSRCP